MFCNQCGHENRNDRKFCAECGAPLRDYTKERENLVMPEDLKKESIATQNYNKKISVLTTVSNILVSLACVLLILSFVITNETLQLIDLIVCLLIYIAFFVLVGIKSRLNSKREKALSTKENQNIKTASSSTKDKKN